jgi:hypothetical protein
MHGHYFLLLVIEILNLVSYSLLMRFSILMTIIVSGGIAVSADAQNISFAGKNISLPVFFL